MCCGVAAIVSDSAASLTGYVASTATPKEKRKEKTQLQAQKQVSKMGQHCRQLFFKIFGDNYVGDFRLVEFPHVLHSKYPKNETEK